MLQSNHHSFFLLYLTNYVFLEWFYNLYRKIKVLLQSSHISHPHFPLLLTPYINTVTLLQLMNKYWYMNINQSLYFIQIFLGFTYCP